MRRGDGELSVRHIHFLNWPDMSVPDVDGELFHLVDQIVTQLPNENPMLIHCSAGVGRAGTTIGTGFYILPLMPIESF